MYHHVLIPVSFEADRNTKQALEVGKALAGAEGRITLLHVQESVPGYVAGYLPANFKEEARAELIAQLSKITEGLSNAEVQVVEGHASRTISDWAAHHDVGCIVVASHRPGVQNILIGSTATNVVRHAPCAVHVIR